ncbi:hypothetical protein T05_4974 [Trichinella murrelli]|uniref:Transmembrane protein n=1 Tax=Trichinella murrelli TaxID=144512 RepID=A0A0V0U0M5_9BILA|nr:hypothetical protein T05_4974 [Trichinella murrelli]
MALPSIGPEICVASLITGVRIGYLFVYLIRNHVYVITKHYYQLMPLSWRRILVLCKSKSKKTRKLWVNPADSTLIAFPTVLMFFLVTQVRNCEDESRILNDLH